jgi:hypothetical protein
LYFYLLPQRRDCRGGSGRAGLVEDAAKTTRVPDALRHEYKGNCRLMACVKNLIFGWCVVVAIPDRRALPMTVRRTGGPVHRATIAASLNSAASLAQPSTLAPRARRALASR